ncbi:MAG: hypothetical protein BWY22_00837 [Bacteroidetes bacterium ADurb.Bin217]|nr:MAG: hypothetical protein BWY22_00837 [Bacteroidetes bacterium ADurb.Bin217]
MCLYIFLKQVIKQYNIKEIVEISFVFRMLNFIISNEV